MNKITQDIFLIFLGACLALLFIKGCANKSILLPESSRTIKSDTIFVKGDTIRITKRILQPYPVYAQVATPQQLAANLCDSIRFYRDTTQIDSTSYFIAEDTVIGKQIWSARHFVGVPYFKQVTTTITDSIPYAVVSYKGGWYLSGGIGLGIKNCLYLGGDYVSAKKWSVGYAYDLLNKTNNGFFRYRVY